MERVARGWSSSELARKAQVSRAMIDKIENARCSPTASMLGKLSGAFGLTMSTLLARAESGQRSRLHRLDSQPVWKDPETNYVRRQVLPVPGSVLPVDLVVIVLPGGAVVTFPASSYAFIRQAIWVQQGELHFVEGVQEHRLGEGDCLELGLPQECRFENRSPVDCTYVVVVLRQG